MHQIPVGGGVHRDGAYIEFFAGAQDAKCNLAAIGDEDLIQLGHGAILLDDGD